MLLLLLGLLTLLFYKSFVPGQILFSNDGPLGRLVSECHKLPGIYTGGWQDLNSVGYSEGGAVPSISSGLRWLLRPVGFAKFYAPLALLLLGLSAWCFFRQLGLVPLACLLGGLAATLNSGFFSTACWGVAAHAITVGIVFLALAALVQTASWRGWLRAALAGLAVGMGVTEGADIGAMFSLFVAAFVVHQAWAAEGRRVKNLALGVTRLALVALLALALAAQSLAVLATTEIQGVAGAQQDARTRAQRWSWATQWSLPKREALGLIVPGVFGYRMDTPEGGNYWGAGGRDANWDLYFASGKKGPPPTGFLRYAGGGAYAGVLVVLVGLWAVAQSLRPKGSVFSAVQCRSLWFWLGVGIVALLLAFGRYAPFYRFVYALPYASTIRNPAKFLSVLSLTLVVLFAYGVDGLWRKYVPPAASGAKLAGLRLRSWWAQAAGFEKRWAQGCVAALGTSLLAWLFYAGCRPSLEQYLQFVQFDPDTARDIAGFSVRQVGWFVLFFVLGAFLLALFFSGAFAGARARWGGILLGLLLVADLGRANLPWIVYWDVADKYATNPIIDLLRQHACEHRVAIVPLAAPPPLAVFQQLYRSEWVQHQFPYYDVQTLDVAQMPRKPTDLKAFEDTFDPRKENNFELLCRFWQLTNTRYLLGPASLLPFLNLEIDPAQQRLRVVQSFSVVPKPGIFRPSNLSDLTAVPATDGPFALFEFIGALPRARLFADWQVNTNNQAALAQLASPGFDPEQTVIVGGSVPAAAPVTGASLNAGTVEFAHYSPKDIVLKASAAVPAVLLLNDRFDPNWKVRVDGRPETLLRCNYLMRGVYLAPGAHAVEFRFQPPIGPLYITLAAVGLGLLLLGLAVATGQRSEPPVPTSAPTPQPAAPRGHAQPAVGNGARLRSKARASLV